MSLDRRVVLPLHAALAVLFGVLLLLQVMSLPGQFRYMAEQDPEHASLRWPLTAVSVFLVLCAQVVVVATARLLALVSADRIFSEVSFAWVDTIVGAVGAAWLVLTTLFLLVSAHADDPGVPLLLFVVDVGVAVLGLLMLVMRALLHQATALRTDLEGVV